MGFFKKGNLRKTSEKRERKENKENANEGDPRVQVPAYSTYLKKENEYFQKYYELLNGKEKFESILETLRKDLPTTFRINKDLHTNLIKELIESRYEQNQDVCIEIDGISEKVKKISWYPDQLAYQFNVSRRTLSKTPAVKDFHSFLVNFTESGHISRQEAVSMIPPLLLGALPGEKVLDLCAAPGSKTAQILESLQSDTAFISDQSLLIANDSNLSRCHTLVRQSKRLRSPFLTVTHLDAQYFPALNINDEKSTTVLQFDRILADVPCSGDGTLRKNLDIWKNWSPSNGNGLHKVQKTILLRAMSLVKIGGTIVYSTCSMYPVENEAVISATLRKSKGSFELVDVSDKLPGLITSNGLSSWVVMDKNGFIHEKYDEGKCKAVKLCRSMFCQEDVKNMNLERCIRIDPHAQNTGGFFVAVLNKVAPFGIIDTNNHTTNGDIVKREEICTVSDENGYKKSFDTIESIAKKENMSEIIRSHFGISNLISDNSMVTHSMHADSGNVYLISPMVEKLLFNSNRSKLRPVSVGVKCFVRNGKDKSNPCSYRFSEGGVNVIENFISDSMKVNLNKDDIIAYLGEEHPSIGNFSPEFQEAFKRLKLGGCIGIVNLSTLFESKCNDIELKLPIWISKYSTSLLVKKEYRNILTHLISQQKIQH